MGTEPSASAAGAAPVAAAGAAVAVAAADITGGASGPVVVGEEVDPVAEADVYMAYGRDAQAEEILKESLGKDPNRVPVLGKLLEIYANRRDTRGFEQTALKVKNLTNGTGPEWEKAATLGRTLDPSSGLYGRVADATQAMVATQAGPAPSLDFDVGGGSPAAPSAPAALDFDLGSTSPGVPMQKSDFTDSGTLIMDKASVAAATPALDFNLGDTTTGKTGTLRAAAGQASAGSGPIDFDLNLDLGGAKGEPAAALSGPLDLGTINLNLGAAAGGAPASGDPRWQEVATKLDLAKAYEEMGDKDGARELLGEVLKEGDAAQQGQARQMLTNLG
jgi:pilus assembly protein FimV